MVEKTQKAETRRETSGNTTWKTENFAVTSENSIRSSADNLKANLRFSPEFRSYKNKNKRQFQWQRPTQFKSYIMPGITYKRTFKGLLKDR